MLRKPKTNETREKSLRSQSLLSSTADAGFFFERGCEMKFEGLEEIKNCRAEWEEYYEKREQAQEDEDGCGRFPSPPKSNLAELKKKYPTAAAYLRAEDFSYAANDCKSSAGSRAMAKLEAGEDYVLVLAEMDAEWAEAANRLVENS